MFTLTREEQQVWDRFAAAALTYRNFTQSIEGSIKTSASRAAECADALIVERRKRFGEPPNQSS